MTDDKQELSSILPLLIGSASFIVIIARMKAAAPILNSFLLPSTAIAQGLSSSLLLIFMVIFILLESSGFPLKLQQGLTQSSKILQQFDSFNQSIRHYIFITACTGAVITFFINGI